NVYLDDNMTDRVLIALLKKSGHDVVTPDEVGMSRLRDPVHFLYALSNGRAILTWNYKDLEPLHELVLGAGGSHTGVIVVRKDNRRGKDMKPPDIATAINKVAQSGMTLTDELIRLNDWR